MTEAEYHLIISEQLHLISSIWEYWLASTFAFIVAFHAGRKSITKPLAFIGCGLYMMASVAAILRYVRTVGKINLLNERMTNEGFELLVTNVVVTLGQTLFSMATFILGSIAAVSYAIYQYRARNDT